MSFLMAVVLDTASDASFYCVMILLKKKMTFTEILLLSGFSKISSTCVIKSPETDLKIQALGIKKTQKIFLLSSSLGEKGGVHCGVHAFQIQISDIPFFFACHKNDPLKNPFFSPLPIHL